METHEVILYTEDKNSSITLTFLGWTLERVQEYIVQKFSEHKLWKWSKIIR